MPDERLFIKVILPNQGREAKTPGGGSPPTPFKTVDGRFRARLVGELELVTAQVAQAPAGSPFVPMRVLLESKATAKSHRPDELFVPAGCPIIGNDRPGELFVQASREGLAALRTRISRGTSANLIKAISTVKCITPVLPADRLGGQTVETLMAAAPRHRTRSKALLKVRLFRYPDVDEDARKQAAFHTALQSSGLDCSPLGKAKEHESYVVECNSVDQVRALSQLVMIRSVAALPTFRVLRGQRLGERPLPATLGQVQPNPTEHPVVAVVDSGVTDQIPALQPWIYGRETFVAQAEQNRGHGTFVGGLLVWGHELNPAVPEIEPLHCRLLDVQVLPNTDPACGQTGVLTEQELLENLEYCLIKYANEVKVWNLSLGSDEVCSLDRFSELAVELDDMQERFNVSFVIAAGNYERTPYLAFPRDAQACIDGRITTPADSVLGIAVGSIAHIDLAGHGSRRGEPSPFSRNGPGPNHVIKPDLVHVGGNIGHSGQPAHGITSLDVLPRTVDNMGTSFATPLVARQLAHIYHSITPTPSFNAARAILTHCARDLRTRGRIPEGEDHYFGFGTPLSVRTALECNPWAMTLVFEEHLRPGFFLEWDDFPFPPSLIANGRYRGEIAMTLAYPPRRNADFGAEYCETHIEASFGVFVDGKEGEEFHGQVPVEHVRPKELYESYQVSRLRKWAPVRTFYNLSPNGVKGKRWRLKVRLLCRHGVETNLAASQPFALILTIADPARRAPVYDEMARSLRTRFQTQNLTLRPTVRVQQGGA
jgi:serine protease AprX